MQTTVGQILINEELPEDLRDYNRTLDKGGLKHLLREVMNRYPDRYKSIVHKLATYGGDFATTTGSSFSLNDLKASQTKQRIVADVEAKVKAIADNPKLSDDQRDSEIIKYLASRMDEMRDGTHAEGLAENNNFSKAIKSGARGNPANLSSLRGADLMVLDHKDRPIPIPITRNFSEGITPAEYVAGAYGTRKGIISTKLATAQAGFLCLTENTLVRMADFSVKSIEKVRVGDLVLGADKAGRTFPTVVTAKFDNGVKEVYEYTFRPGRNRSDLVTLKATPQHEVLSICKLGSRSPKGSREVAKRQLSVVSGRLGWGLVPAKEFVGDTGFNEPRALLLGALLGDGDLTGNSIHLSSGDPQFIGTLNERYAEHNLRLRKLNRQAKHFEFILEEINKTLPAREANGKIKPGTIMPIRKWIDELGLLGKKCHEKFIPDCVWGWDQQSVADFIAGLVETDGCVTHSNHSEVPLIKLAMVSKNIIEQCKELLRVRFGVYASPVSTTKATGATDRFVNGCRVVGNHDLHTITIATRESIIRFSELIKLPGVKAHKLDDALSRLPKAKRDDSYTYAFVKKRHLGERKVFDFEVEDSNHMYVLANGIVVSNSKQLANATSRLLVTDETPLEGTGLPVDTDDPDNEGAVLARSYEGFPAGTVLTPSILRALKKNFDEILVHSPISAGGSGVPQLAAGVRERGVMSPLGDNIGIAAAQATSEPISQSQLSAKHAAGVVGAAKETSVSGFQAINQLVQIPKSFQSAAAISRLDGRVSLIEDAPQGGKYVWVGDDKHYVYPDFELEVKVGDSVESGDALSEGIPNPSEVVKYKGIGEGRRYFLNRFRKTLQDNGIGINRRNLELLSRGIINHVRVVEPDGVEGGLPDDIGSD